MSSTSPIVSRKRPFRISGALPSFGAWVAALIAVPAVVACHAFADQGGPEGLLALARFAVPGCALFLVGSGVFVLRVAAQSDEADASYLSVMAMLTLGMIAGGSV